MHALGASWDGQRGVAQVCECGRKAKQVAWHYFSSIITAFGSKLNTKCGVIRFGIKRPRSNGGAITKKGEPTEL